LKAWKITIVFVLFLSPFSHVYAKTSYKYQYSLTYKFQNQGVESIDILDEDLVIPLFLDSPYQTVNVENSTNDLKTRIIDEDGNPGALIDIQRNLGPGDSISFKITYNIESYIKSKPDFELSKAEGIESIPDELEKDYTLSTETFMINDPEINSLAKRLSDDQQTVLEIVIRMLAWFRDNTTYCNYEVPIYPTKTLEDGLGDCDDQAILLITMCRSLGIPAYLQVGIIIHSSIGDSKTSWDGHLTNTQEGVGWHGWAMVYIPPWGWVPVDLTLTQSEEGVDILRKSPEYDPNIITALNISNQPYIGKTLSTRERIINSTLFITIIDEAHLVNNNPFWVNYGIIGLGTAVLISIILLFWTGRKK
jgi:transglutaminase-like putative cysteine protease